MTDTKAAALTEAEEQQYRHPANRNSWYGPHEVNRLLATLDATRAALASKTEVLAVAEREWDRLKAQLTAATELVAELERERDEERAAHKTELTYVDMSGREADAARIAALEERAAELGEELAGERNAREVLIPALAEAHVLGVRLESERDAAKRERDAYKAVLQSLYDGTRDYAARGLGQNLPVEYEMPPSSAKRMRKLIADVLSTSSEPRKGGET